MIALKNVSTTLGDFSLHSVDLDIRNGEYFVILGPSGAGKTVVLEVIAGLRTIRSGQVWINDENVTALSPEERKVGYVPQDYVLFPFLNVFDNVAFGLRAAGHLHLPIRETVTRIAELMGISHLLKRNVRTLSGGEKQRTALARALVLSPNVLLLDEPLSSLDLQTAKYLRLELKRIHRDFGTTIVHVTHNQSEAVDLADRVGILNLGYLEQVGTPGTISNPLNRPAGSVALPEHLSCENCPLAGKRGESVTPTVLDAPSCPKESSR